MARSEVRGRLTSKTSQHDATFDPFDQPLQRLFTFTSPELALFPFTLLQGLALTHDDPIEPNTLTQMTSPTLVTSVYPLSTLQTYVQRPSAITKCFISDVYALRACVPADVQGTSYIGRGESAGDIDHCTSLST
jgi:hypothetical protein